MIDVFFADSNHKKSLSPHKIHFQHKTSQCLIGIIQPNGKGFSTFKHLEIRHKVQIFQKRKKNVKKKLTKISSISRVGMHYLAPLPYQDPKGLIQCIRRYTLEKMDADCIDEFSALAYGSSLINYVTNKHDFVYFLMYEDFMEDPKYETKDLFKALDIEREFVPRALTALKKDSQGHFFGSTNGKKNDVLTEKNWDNISKIFQLLNIPISTSMTLNDFRKALASFNYDHYQTKKCSKKTW